MQGLVNLLLGASIDETMVRCICLIAIIDVVSGLFCLIGNFYKR